MAAVARTVAIDADREAAVAYLRHVPNLVEWTTFSIEVGPGADGRHPVQSVLGPIETWIEDGPAAAGTRLEVCSLIGGRVERASLDVFDRGGRVDVRFVVTLPDGLGLDAHAGQHAEMGQELARLRELLEAAHAGV